MILAWASSFKCVHIYKPRDLPVRFFLQIEIIINIIVITLSASFEYIMVYIYSHYDYFYIFGAEIDIRRQHMTSIRRHMLTSLSIPALNGVNAAVTSKTRINHVFL